MNIRQTRQIATKSGWTGIYKESVKTPVHVGQEGLEGDQILDRENHGGPEQAVYVYTQPDYEWWTPQLGAAPHPGIFGENLLFPDLQSAPVLIGQRFGVGEVVLEVISALLPRSIAHPLPHGCTQPATLAR
ncbi:MOSC domain-containing protein [Deinococcus sp. QL22]|uniref:MOSC domain-containing protein n=1 Tax=Deinococcus sp. QL22 TaxID=2939437 RepID=UPI002017DFA9|nr:MOSC domain-containing protein [Deinococcus sp. QL22]UQN10624.1 MOSC domain-containing protein [Deinococcus sp. QL22]